MSWLYCTCTCTYNMDLCTCDVHVLKYFKKYLNPCLMPCTCTYFIHVHVHYDDVESTNCSTCMGGLHKTLHHQYIHCSL